MLSRQIVKGATNYSNQVLSEIPAEELMTVTNLKLVGRRSQDADNIEKRILGEDKKASCLTRTKLTIDEVWALALSTKPTNDATFTFNAIVLRWRMKVEKMSTVVF